MKILIGLLLAGCLYGQSKVVVNPFPPGSGLELVTKGAGTLTSLTTACGLTGGPITTTGTVSQALTPAAHNGSYAILTTDCGLLLSTNVAAAWTIAQAGTTGFESGKFWRINNVGSGSLTITATTSTFYGGPTAQISGSVLTVAGSTGVTITSDGANFQVVASSGGNPGTVTTVSVATANGLSGTVANPTTTPALTLLATASGDTSGPLTALVTSKINGVALSGLATGIFKNTTTTGVPSIAIAADFPTLNQSTSGNAATATALAATPTKCSAGNYPLGVDVGGNAQNCTAASSPTATINPQTGTTYTLVSGDNGKVITFNNASAVTLTVPASLGSGFNCLIIQIGAGAVTPTASSTTINQRQAFTKTAGQYATATLVAYAADTFVLSGDLQ